MNKENNKVENNEKSNSNSLKRSSYSLIVVASITLFMMLVFFSYSLFGGGKGTYSSTFADWSCPSGSDNLKLINNVGYCCPNGTNFSDTTRNNLLQYQQYYDNVDGHTCVPNGMPQAPSVGSDSNNHNQYIMNNTCYIVGVEIVNGRSLSSVCDDLNGIYDNTTVKTCTYQCTFMPIMADDLRLGPILRLDRNNGKFVANDPSIQSVVNSYNNVYTDSMLFVTRSGELLGGSCDDDGCTRDLSLISASREGYTFNGWGTSESCTSGNKGTIRFSNDVNLYACWQKTIKVYGINGSSDYQEIPCKKQDGSNLYVTENVDAGTNSNKHFEGWSTNSICNPIVIEQKNASFTCSGNNYYACWKSCSRYATVSYELKGGNSGPDSDSVCVDPKGTYHVSDVVPTKSKARFLNWNTKSDGSGTSYGPSDALDVTSSIILYAQWKSLESSGESCTYKVNGGDTSISECNGTVTYTGRIQLSSLEKCVSNSGKCIKDWTVKFSDGATDIYSSYIDADENDCGITLTPNWQACSSGGSGGDNGGGTGNDPKPTDPDPQPGSSEPDYLELTPAYDRCYNNKWVRVVSCQPDGTGAKCKLSTGETVDKATIKKAKTTGCDVPNGAFDRAFDEDRCNMATGKIVHIASCQVFDDVIGAHCKDKDGNYIFMGNLAAKENSACKNYKPPVDNSSSDPADQDVDSSVQTGTTAFVLSMIAAIIALGISFYYFRRNYFVKQ